MRITMLELVDKDDALVKNYELPADLPKHIMYVVPDAMGQALIDAGKATLERVFISNGEILTDNGWEEYTG